MRKILLAGVCVLSCAPTASLSTSPPVVFIKGPHGSAATPSIAARGADVAVAFSSSDSTGGTDVFVSTSRDAGRTFGAPVRVNETAGDARVNGEQPPRIAIRDRRIVVVWTSKRAKSTVLLQSRSEDDGRTFSRAVVVPGSDAAGNRGWENADGRFAVWLDHRELAQDENMMTAMHHERASAGKPDGVAMAQKSQLFIAGLDGSVAPRALTGGVCYCCKTALAESADGSNIYLAWRHVYPGNFRDIAFTISRDDGRTFAAPVRVSQDKWMLEGCPDDGPSLAVDASQRVHLAWPTLVTSAAGEPTIGLFYATSADGQSFSAREAIPTEAIAHHPQIAIGADGVPVIAWDETQSPARHIVVARRTATAAGPRYRRQVVGDGLYPALAASADATLAAWTSRDNATIAVQRLDR